MKGNFFIVFLLFILLISGCSERNRPETEPVVRACAVMPSPRASASACALGNKGYVFGGRDQNGRSLKDLWVYDSETDSWSVITSFPGKARVRPLMIAANDALYIGLGFAGGHAYAKGAYLQDFWRYTPADGKWTRLADGLDRNGIGGVPYHVGTRIYMLYATGWSYTDKEVYYDLTEDQWAEIPYTHDRAESCLGGAGGQCAGRCFFGAGVRKENLCQWYEVDLPSDTWTKRSSIPGKGRTLSAYCSTDRYIYLFGGRYFAGEHTGGEIFDEWLRYDVPNDRWEYCGEMPLGRAENMIAFTIEGKAYFGLGENENGEIINQFYSIEE